ncbi:UNVERIFIED_CONTAM: hypothetical protein RMT77_003064 [Armadillidium vulgare]
MGQYTKIIILTAMFLNSIFLVRLQTPEERCQAVGDPVCFDCKRSGICADDGNGNFIITDIADCLLSPVMTYCDDSLDGNSGQCTPLPPSYTNCTCTSSSGSCKTDPNDMRIIIHCDENPPVTDPPCSGPADLTTCACLSCSATCPLVNDPTDNCTKYYFCNDKELIPGECSGGLCFDQTVCQCSDKVSPSPSTQTTAPTTTPTTTITSTSSTSSSALTCPSGCPFVDDPTDNCGSFYICENGGITAHSCPGVLCFNQANCQCQ